MLYLRWTPAALYNCIQQGLLTSRPNKNPNPCSGRSQVEPHQSIFVDGVINYSFSRSEGLKGAQIGWYTVRMDTAWELLG